MFCVEILMYKISLTDLFMFICVTGREEWTPDSEQMFHHFMIGCEDSTWQRGG